MLKVILFNFVKEEPQTLMEKTMAPHSRSLAWKIPWTEEPGRLQSMGSLRVGHHWATSLSLFTFHVPALEKEMATHSSILAWKIPGTGEIRTGGILRLDTAIRRAMCINTNRFYKQIMKKKITKWCMFSIFSQKFSIFLLLLIPQN